MANSPWRRYVADSIATMYFGVFFTTLYCWFVAQVSAYPDQRIAFVAVSVIYVIWWEYVNSGWRGWRSVQSSGYFIGGSALYLAIDMQWVIDRLMLFGLGLSIPLAIGAIAGCSDERNRN